MADNNPYPSFRAFGLLEAVAILEREIQDKFRLSVESNREGVDGDNFALKLRRFAAAIRNNHHIDTLELYEYYSYESLNADDASEQLLGEVLGSHSSLTNIHLNNKQEQQSPLRYIYLGSMRINDDKGILAITQLLRANTLIEKLSLQTGITSAGCDAIFEAMDGNTHLRELDMGGNLISNVSLSAVQALSRSNLRVLDLGRNRTSFESCQVLAQGLRTNTSLEVLKLRFFQYAQKSESELSFVDLVTSFNFTLRSMKFSKSGDGPDYLKRGIKLLLRFNREVRKAHANLQSLSYHMEQRSLWPQTLEIISSKPSLVYHFIRAGNLPAFANHVVQQNNINSQHNKLRPRDKTRGDIANSDFSSRVPDDSKATMISILDEMMRDVQIHKANLNTLNKQLFERNSALSSRCDTCDVATSDVPSVLLNGSNTTIISLYAAILRETQGVHNALTAEQEEMAAQKEIIAALQEKLDQLIGESQHAEANQLNNEQHA